MRHKKTIIQFTSNTILIGIIIMLLGDFLFAANDAMGKWLSVSFSAGQILFVRSIGAFIVLGPLLPGKGSKGFFTPQKPIVLFIRVVCATGDTGLFYAAVAYLPLTDVMTFYMAGPIYVAILSHFFLGEKMGWRRWLAIFIGFSGVLIALQPSAQIFESPGTLFALLASFCFALLIILSRVLRETSDTVLVTWQTIGALIAGAFFCFFSWSPPSTIQWLSLLLLGVVSCLGHLFISRATKLAPASLLAPLQYTLLLWAILFDFFIFKHPPAWYTIVGAIIIILSGLFIFHRKKVVDQNVIEQEVKADLV